jgi:hypothetical protein
MIRSAATTAKTAGRGCGQSATTSTPRVARDWYPSWPKNQPPLTTPKARGRPRWSCPGLQAWRTGLGGNFRPSVGGARKSPRPIRSAASHDDTRGNDRLAHLRRFLREAARWWRFPSLHRTDMGRFRYSLGPSCDQTLTLKHQYAGGKASAHVAAIHKPCSLPIRSVQEGRIGV